VTTTAPLVDWLRPEYKGREGELINQNDIATLAKVSRSAVSNWTTRYDDFPDVVATIGTTASAPRLYVRGEVDAYLQKRAARPRAQPASRAPNRSRREIWTERADRAERQVDAEQQRVDDLYRDLGRATARLKRAQETLDTARSVLSTLPDSIARAIGNGRVDSTT
jgi:hypothetical protein